MTSKIISGTVWSFLQKFGGLAIGFIANMTLARLLCPEDFGTIGMIMVFVSFADVLVDGGLGNALIQKRNVTEDDYSTVFLSNLLFSLAVFSLLFFLAPVIETYTSISQISIYLRVQAILILIRALYVVPYSILTKKLLFKSLAKINLLSSSISVSIAISLAYVGGGVWSLICRNILFDAILLFFLYSKSQYKIKIRFNKKSFNELFGFGIFVVFSNLIENLYSNAVTFFTGKQYSVRELGYYNQAYALQQMPVYSLSSVLNQVLFPYFSKIQCNRDEVRYKLKCSIQLVTFVIFPLLLFLICYANQVISLVYSPKWLPCVAYFQLFCIAGMFNAMIHINRSLLKSHGFTKTIFRIQIANTVIGICLLLFFLRISMKATVCAFVVNSLLLFLMTTYASGKKIGYSIVVQLGNVLPNFVISLICILIDYYVFKCLSVNIIMALVLEFLFFVSLYVSCHFIFNTNVFQILKIITKNFKSK